MKVLAKDIGKSLGINTRDIFFRLGGFNKILYEIKEIKEKRVLRTTKQAVKEYQRIYPNKISRNKLKNEQNWIYQHFCKCKLLDIYCLESKPKNLKHAIKEYKRTYPYKISRQRLLKEKEWIHGHFFRHNLLNKYCLPKYTKEKRIGGIKK